MNDLPQTMNQIYTTWPPQSLADHVPFQFPNPNRPPPPPFPVPTAAAAAAAAGAGRTNWKAKNRKKSVTNPRNTSRPGDNNRMSFTCNNPPGTHELESRNRIRSRRFYPKRKYDRFVPFAPRNTSSFIIRAKKSGGIASLVSPCPVTPAVLPTPKFSPTSEVLVDMAKEEWGVDGYGSMKGIIRLRSPNEGGIRSDEDGSSESESDVDDHLEMERRLDHDLSRFEMVYPADEVGPGVNSFSLENRVDDHDSQILQLEEENLTLKERVFLMEQEMGELRRRMELLEKRNCDGDCDDDTVGENENGDNDCVNGVEEEASENDGSGDVVLEKSIGDCEESASTPLHDN